MSDKKIRDFTQRALELDVPAGVAESIGLLSGEGIRGLQPRPSRRKPPSEPNAPTESWGTDIAPAVLDPLAGLPSAFHGQGHHRQSNVAAGPDRPSGVVTSRICRLHPSAGAPLLNFTP